MKNASTETVITRADIEKYALRFLAASTDTANEAYSDAAADLYRERYGEDYGEETFDLATLRKGP